MPSVVGVDLSSKAIDLVKLNENDNHAQWVRCELAGEDAWERTMAVKKVLSGYSFSWGNWWDDVYLVAIEKPVNDQHRVLSRVQGAILASLPADLRDPLHCWEVHPSTWKAALGLKGKPTANDLERITGDPYPFTGSEYREPANENARDAYCIALYARDTNAQAIQKATAAPTAP